MDLWLNEGCDEGLDQLSCAVCMLVQLIMQLYNYHIQTKFWVNYCKIKCNYAVIGLPHECALMSVASSLVSMHMLLATDVHRSRIGAASDAFQRLYRINASRDVTSETVS